MVQSCLTKEYKEAQIKKNKQMSAAVCNVAQNTIKEIKVSYRDKFSTELTVCNKCDFIRLSMYFDYTTDNYHTQVSIGSSKHEVISALHSLIKLIKLSMEGETDE
jgi:hypothetical protein